MDDIAELILEIIFEGAVEAAGSKKVPLPLRILLAGVILLIFLGLFALLFFAGINSGSIALAVAAALLSIGAGVLAFFKIRQFLNGGD